VSLPPETLINLVARNPGRTVRELLRILAREGGPTLTKRQLNLALYRSPSLHWKPGAGEKRVWYVSDMGHTPPIPLEVGPVVRRDPSKGLSLYPWQREALEWWGKRGHRGVIEAVTGAGKTRVALEAAGEDPERMAEQLVNKTLQDTYLQSLAMMVQEYPHGPQGIIDYYRDRETKAGLRYKRWMDEKTEALVKGLGRKMTDEMIEKGVYELVIGEDGKEYLKLGPNYEAYYRERGLEPPL
jgi:hypothetical protein